MQRQQGVRGRRRRHFVQHSQLLLVSLTVTVTAKLAVRKTAKRRKGAIAIPTLHPGAYYLVSILRLRLAIYYAVKRLGVEGNCLYQPAQHKGSTLEAVV